MTEVFVMSDGDHSNTTSDCQELIDDSNGWGKLKRNRYKILGVGLTAVVLVSCIVAVAVTHSGSISTDQSSSTTNDQSSFKNGNSQDSRSFVNQKKQFGKKFVKREGNTNEGRQFAIAFPSIYSVGSSGNMFMCLIIARETAKVIFDSRYLGLNKTVGLDAGAVYTETFERSYQTTDGIEDKAIYITADGDIIVQCAGTDQPDTDSFLALPHSENDTEYLLAVCDEYPDSSTKYIGFVNVVATANNTQVNISCPPVVSECQGKSYIVELQRYEIYSLYVREYSDLTGFYIKANHPVSVYTGSPNLPLYDGSEYRTYQFLTFSVHPLHQLGTLHYAPETIGDPSRLHRLRIVATESTNLLIPQKGVNEIIERYEFFTQDYSYFTESVGPLEVSCSAPCLVIHCNKEHYPNTNHAYMMRVIPTQAYSDNIVFSSVDYFDQTYDHYLSIVVSQYPVTDLYLDGNSLASEDWSPALSGNQAGVMLMVSSGLHHLNSTNRVKFAAYSQGNGVSHISYGYGNPAGVGRFDSEDFPPEPTSEPDARDVPGYRVNLWGNFTSFDGKDFTMECGAAYATELGDKANDMIPIVNGLLGDVLCSNMADGDIVILSTSSTLTTSGPNGQTWVAFIMELDQELSFEAVHDCGAEVTIYLLDHTNWGIPLLPPIDGCPFPVFDPPRFYDEGSEWMCASTLLEESSPAAGTPDFPGYDIVIEGNFTTFTGEDLSVDCGTRYSSEFDSQTADMFLELNSRLGSSLCAGTTFSILNWNSVFYYAGSEGITTVTYVLKSDVTYSIEDVFECTDEIMPFVLDHVNWGLPLLPQLPGCPFLVFFEQRFWEKDQKWNCDVSLQAANI